MGINHVWKNAFMAVCDCEFTAIAALHAGNPSFTCIAIFGVYINYYRDGQDYTPNHSHNSKQ